MAQERRKGRGWLPLALGAAGLAAGVVIGGAWAVKELEISTEWEIGAPPDKVFEALLEADNYADWWPQISAQSTTAGPLISAATVVQAALRLPLGLLPLAPTLHLTVRFPQIERNLRIRARLTGDVAGIAEWILVPQGKGTLLKSNTRLRLSHPLLNLAALALPESTWRSTLEGMLIEARAGLQRSLEFAEADLAFSRR
jgi:carbon monoxide dehydrogenase subunit G